MNKLAYVQYALLGVALIVLVYVAIHDSSYVERPTEIEIVLDDGDHVLIRSEAPAPVAVTREDPAPTDAPSPPPEVETNYAGVNDNTPGGGGR